jgi:hypothetical protein
MECRERALIAASASALLCAVVLALAASAAAAPIDNPRDIDKYRYDSLLKRYFHAYDEHLPPVEEHCCQESIYFGTPPSGAAELKDMSCWMAAACNILDYELGGYGWETYKSMIKGYLPHAIPGSFMTPWGDVHTCNGGCEFFTFDDAGYICQVLTQEMGTAHECIWTTEEFADPGWAGQNPVQWCASKLAADHPVGLMIWWGDAPNRGCHAITLWEMYPPSGTEPGRLLITDSDDESSSSNEPVVVREVPFTWDGGNWLVNDPLYSPVCHVNWCSAALGSTTTEPSSWSRIKAAFRER